MLSTILGFLLPVLFGVAGTWLTNRLNNNTLTGAQQEQNSYNAFQAQQQRDWSTSERVASQEFNAEQAQINRDFQAQQVQNQMDFQREMDSSVYQRRVADMKAAGVNPALAIGGVSVGSTAGASGAGSQATSTPGSGASASGSVSPFAASMSDIMQSAFFRKNLGVIESQIRMNDAKTMRDLADAGLLKAQTVGQNLANNWFVPKSEVELANMESDLRSKGVKRALDRQNISESQAREALTLTQNIIAKADADIRDELNRAALSETLKRAEYYGASAHEASVRANTLVPAEVNELYQRAIMEGLEGGKFSAEELESMERAGLLRLQQQGQANQNVVSGVAAGKAAKNYEIYKPKLEYWLGIAGQTAGIIGDVTSGASRVYGAIKVGQKINSDLFNTKDLRKPSGTLWTPNSQSAFGTQYSFR